MDLKNILHKGEIEYLKHHWGSNFKIQVYSNIKDKDSSIFLRSYLIPNENIGEELQTENIADIVYQPGYVQVNNEIIYKNFHNYCDVEPIIIERRFDGLIGDSIELAEEFRLLFNLYYDFKTKTFVDLEHRRIVVEFKQSGNMSRPN